MAKIKGRIIEEAKKLFMGIRKRLYDCLSACFESLQAEGLMRPDIKTRRYETLAYILVMLATFWGHKYSPHCAPKLPKIGLVQAASDLIFPCLTD